MPENICVCLMIPALIALSIIDYREQRIPVEITGYIGILGLVHLLLVPGDRLPYLSGGLIVSVPLELLYLASRGRGIGGGDIRLMAAAGLLLGRKKIILAFFLGCLSSVIVQGSFILRGRNSRVFAFGPYLSAGICTAILMGDSLIHLYERSGL